MARGFVIQRPNGLFFTINNKAVPADFFAGEGGKFHLITGEPVVLSNDAAQA